MGVNVFVWLITWPAMRLEMVPWFVFIPKIIEDKLPRSLTIIKFLTYSNFHLHCITPILLNIWRFSFIQNGCTKPNMWRKYCILAVPICTIASIVIQLCLGFPQRVEIQEGKLVTITETEEMKNMDMKIAVASMVYYTINRGLCIVNSYLGKKKLNYATSSKMKKKMNKIIYSYVMAYSFELIWCVFNGANLYLDFMPPYLAETVRPILLLFASDIFTLLPPFAFFFIDEKFQKVVKKWLPCKKKNFVTNTCIVIT